MTIPKNRLQEANRIAWMLIFLTVAAAMAWAEWSGGPGSGVGWFLAISLWSAVCGIGYSIGDWLLRGKAQTARDKGSATQSGKDTNKPEKQ